MTLFLEKKIAFYFLLALNIAVSLAVFNIAKDLSFPDSKGYLLMGESILHGKFSSWHFLPKYYPETLRTPGYPAFIALLHLVSSSELLIKIVQFLLYFGCVFFCIQIIRKYYPQLIYTNVFLLLLIPNIQVVYYSGYISSEILNTFFVILSMYLFTRKRSYGQVIFLAITCYCAFIVRPSFLIFPFLMVAYSIFIAREEYKLHTTFITLFVILLIPFGVWNKVNHGIFKITPLEGGAGVMHIGFWAYKLPAGYTEPFYWGNSTGYDLTQPKFYSVSEQKENQKKYEKECTALWSKLDVYETPEDTFYLSYMKNNNPGIFPLHNSRYTIEREKLLNRVTVSNVMNEPFYTFKCKLYQIVRFYVTGINFNDWNKAESFASKLKCIYPTLITLFSIFSGLLFITFILFSIKYFESISSLLLCYFGIMALYIYHLPQADSPYPLIANSYPCNCTG
nr:hypothetical protein [Bacteroidota bacterium]